MRIKPNSSGKQQGFSLMEASIASSIAAMTFGGIVFGYTQSGRNSEWSSYSLAAQSIAIQRMEQSRACKWDPDATPAVDELQATNFPPQTNILDVPIAGTNITYVTNITTISTVSATPPLKMISVQSTWRFTNGRVFTNSVVTYRAPDA
jgi:Tfp pilus assembly protein PilV